ncbi:MAG: DEAD/DEAH box helicase [Corynebacterium sp.]|nr:DEAD/DEAH box helicase [Corynebacterium sp.]
MASFLLHGLWLPVSGLSLWIEQVDGHKIVLPQAVPEGTFPPAVEALLANKSFRTRSKIYLRTPKGKNVELMVPMARFGPDDAVEALSKFAFLDSSSDDIPAMAQSQRATIAPDLLWLVRAYKGLARFVRAGRVTIRLSYQAGEWYPMWQLTSGVGERGWLAEMIAAAPGVLTINNRNLSEDIANELTHWIAHTMLKDALVSPRPYPWHDFARALLQTTAITRGRTALLRGLNEWKESITAVDLGLIFVVEEPRDTPEELDPAYRDTGEISPAETWWPVRVRVRSGADTPRPVCENQFDTIAVQTLRESRRRAIAISPKLSPEQGNTATSFSSQGGAFSAAGFEAEGIGSETGDWDVYLRTDDLVDFVTHDVPALQKAGFAVLLPKAWTHMSTRARLVTKEVTSETSLHSKVGMDQLMEYNWRLSVGSVELSDEEMTELANSKSGLIKLRGEWVMADTSALSKIAGYMEELSSSSIKLRRKELDALAKQAERARIEQMPGWEDLAQEVEKQLAAFNEEASRFDEASGVVTLAELRELALESMAHEPVEFTGSTWHSSLLGGMETPAPQGVEIPDTVRAELRHYQKRGVDWLYWMSRNNVGAVLADDMGLGKTLQLLTLLAVEHTRGESQGPTLVVCPTSVVGNWAREAKKFVPHLRVLVFHGLERPTGEAFIEAANQADIIISSYGTVGRDYHTLGQVFWDHVVLDEAQAIKNAATRASKAVRSLPARQRIALTGTPVENRLSEMRSILDFCNPGVLGSATFFRNHFASAIEKYQDEEMSERLRRLTSPFILRRLKTDVAIIDDLPQKTEQLLTVAMTPEQAALYKAYVDNVQAEMANKPKGTALRGLVLASLTRIKQICNHPAHFLGDGGPMLDKGKHRSGKVEKLMEIIDSALASGERMLIFTQYKAFGDLLQPYLSDRVGANIPYLHGGVSKRNRDSMVEDFQSEDGPPIMLLSLKAGGTGLNLTAANVVVHMDRWWNPAVENQATDRAFRIGQRKDVRVFKMITAGTLEESIQEIIDGKTQLAGAVVGEGEGWITELDPEQLAQLMSYRGKEN